MNTETLPRPTASSLRDEIAGRLAERLAADPALGAAYRLAADRFDLMHGAAKLLAAGVPRLTAIEALSCHGYSSITAQAALDVAAERSGR